MAKPISNITIVGGGTSGWITACYLARFFSQSMRRGEFSITLIESPNIGIIGVGESTARPIADLLRIIGVKESDFIKRCNASFKLGGYFTNWETDKDGKPLTWVNPFYSQTDIRGINPAYLYAAYAMNEGGGPLEEDFTEAISVCPALIRAHKGPRPLDSKDYETEVPYSYHMDAIELAKILMEQGKTLGVKQILDDVDHVQLDEKGYVRELTLRKHGAHPIEFIIDATGFAGVIIGKAMGEPFEPYDKYLLNDRAAVAQLPHEDPTRIEPTSRATGMNAGWSFRVPLYNRVGTGYIYSSQFTSDDEAIEEFKSFSGPLAANAEPRVIRMRIGKVRRSWVKNCLAIGLSSGFVEPLEATAIYSVQVALKWFYNYFPDTSYNPAVIDRYNQLIDGLYKEIVEFICLLFYLSNREDTPYWKTVRHDMQIPPGLEENLEVWKSTMPDEQDLKANIFFTQTSYRVALMGKGFYKGRAYRQAEPIEEAEWREYLYLRRQRAQHFLNTLPDNYELLRRIRGEDPKQPTFQIRPTVLTGGGL